MGYLIGIDGGGTKTTGVLADRDGRVLARATGGPGNYLKVGREAVRRAFAQVIGSLRRAAGLGHGAPVDGLCAGLAGADRPRDRKILMALFRDLVDTPVILLESDARITLAGAIEGHPGLIVIAGTGSVAMGVNARGEYVRAGGWGHIVGDEGSGYDIGRRAMALALQSYDGRIPGSRLEEAVQQALQLRNMPDLVTRVYARGLPADQVAALYPAVIEAAARGDAAARALLTSAGEVLCDTAMAVIRKLGMPRREAVLVALSGGVFKVRGHVYRAFRRALRRQRPHARVIEPRHPPEVGAVALVRARLEGRPLEEVF